MNPDNSKYWQLNRQKVLFALIDGQWHRNRELKKETGLTARTLSKHLDELEKDIQWVERKEDAESGEYPHPVLYRADKGAVACTKYIKYALDNADRIEEEFAETKDPFLVLKNIHKLEEYHLYLFLLEIEQIKYMNKKKLDAFLHFTFYQAHEIFIEALNGAIIKAAQYGKKFDTEKLVKRHGIVQPEENFRPPDAKNH